MCVLMNFDLVSRLIDLLHQSDDDEGMSEFRRAYNDMVDAERAIIAGKKKLKSISAQVRFLKENLAENRRKYNFARKAADTLSRLDSGDEKPLRSSNKGDDNDPDSSTVELAIEVDSGDLVL
jgi:hypothetical protein